MGGGGRKPPRAGPSPRGGIGGFVPVIENRGQLGRYQSNSSSVRERPRERAQSPTPTNRRMAGRPNAQGGIGPTRRRAEVSCPAPATWTRRSKRRTTAAMPPRSAIAFPAVSRSSPIGPPSAPLPLQGSVDTDGRSAAAREKNGGGRSMRTA